VLVRNVSPEGAAALRRNLGVGLRMLRRQYEERVAAYEANPKRCEQCGEGMTYGQRHGRFCSMSCSNRRVVRRARSGPFSCLHCGHDLAISGRRFCSVAHAHAYNQGVVVNAWLRGEISGASDKDPEQLRSPIRRYLLEKAGRKCAVCGWNEVNPVTLQPPLHIDHIDGNSRNHAPDNLRVLCPNCHALTPTYGALNYGKGRKRKR
jgi:5-methylcytosine-specific restriction endonuclease McrA